MANDISDRLSYIGINDDSNPPDSSVDVIHSHTGMDNRDTSTFIQHSTNELHAKELRRTSLPADALRKSKLTSWVQYNIPTPPSSRTNSNSSSYRSRSSAGSSSTSDTASFSIPSPTSSPTSIEAPQLPTPINTDMKSTPPRTSSLQSNIHSSTASMEEQQPKFASPLKSMSFSSSSSASSSSPVKKKKKKLFPLVSRIRLCPYDKCSKHAPVIDPPEPPPQLLMSTLHCDRQRGSMNKKKYHSSTNLEHRNQHHRLDHVSDSMPSSSSTYTSQQPPPPSSSSHSSSSWYDCKNITQTTLANDSKGNGLTTSHQLRRRSSCPLKYTRHGTMQEAVMMRSFCSPVNSPALQSGLKSPLTSATTNSSSSLTASLPPDVYDHYNDNDHECILPFSTMKPRSQPLRRRTSGKHEKKALRIWHDTLVEYLENEKHGTGSISSSNRSSSSSFAQPSTMSKEKQERNILTRKFILREFYLTELTFWNQLYYSKVMFSDTLQDSLERYGAFTRTSDVDLFANLPDLMQCSSQLIRSMAPYLDHPPSAKSSASTPSTPSSSHQELPNANTSLKTTLSNDQDSYSSSSRHRRHLSYYEGSTNLSEGLDSPAPSALNSTSTRNSTPRFNRLPFHLDSDARMLPSPNNQLLLGKELCMMANQFVVYLRCALDYKVNRKKLDHRSQHNKGFVMYQEKLSKRKETNQFYVHDFLIIPIQRIARYGLLLADLQKHTDKTHPDYYHISRARMIMTALAVAMNKAQQ